MGGRNARSATRRSLASGVLSPTLWRRRDEGAARFRARRPGSSDGPVINQVIIGLDRAVSFGTRRIARRVGGTFQASASFRRATNARRMPAGVRGGGVRETRRGVDTRRRTGRVITAIPRVAFSSLPEAFSRVKTSRTPSVRTP